MKILTKNKIVEAFHFPFTEALIFSILVWSAWGLAEAFYWDRISPMLDSNVPRADSFIYMHAFFIYVAIAAFLAPLIYVGMRILLAAFDLHNSRTFRAATLCVILGMFLIAALFHYLNSSYLVILLGIAFSFFLLFLLYRWASGDDFRIRRSGTMMLSIFVISVVLSFVPFPIFSSESNPKQQKQAQPGYRRLMAYHYLLPLLEP
ncbi:transglutaminaseTgpA domain-containing protein [bacterium]|nr:transglutaminaseTgpA domain-containing protein [bacterium]MCI0605306.1 transglutaminaseTgpA domain-containing protein [bacterium]